MTEITIPSRMLCILKIMMKKDEIQAQSHAFLLRIWPSEVEDHKTWHCSLESIPNGERIGFGDVVDLAVFIESLTSTKLGSA